MSSLFPDWQSRKMNTVDNDNVSRPIVINKGCRFETLPLLSVAEKKTVLAK
jgi:hypothetical protein